LPRAIVMAIVPASTHTSTPPAMKAHCMCASPEMPPTCASAGSSPWRGFSSRCLKSLRRDGKFSPQPAPTSRARMRIASGKTSGYMHDTYI
jgi:hypothetical protein